MAIICIEAHHAWVNHNNFLMNYLLGLLNVWKANNTQTKQTYFWLITMR